MNGLDVGDGILLVVVGYVAVLSLVRLMAAHRRKVADQLHQQIHAEQLRKQAQAKREKKDQQRKARQQTKKNAA